MGISNGFSPHSHYLVMSKNLPCCMCIEPVAISYALNLSVLGCLYVATFSIA